MDFTTGLAILGAVKTVLDLGEKLYRWVFKKTDLTVSAQTFKRISSRLFKPFFPYQTVYPQLLSNKIIDRSWTMSHTYFIKPSV
jgi:hypothetical protein